MICSEGNNIYKDNRFSFWVWSAPILQTPEEVVQKVKELRLEGRVIKDIIAIGMGYGWTDDNIADMAYNAYERLHPALRKKMSEAQALLSAEIKLDCATTIDEPMLIVFEDGDVLGISFDEGSSVRMELNTIPVTIEPGINGKTFHANRLFRDMIGKTIVEVCVTSTTKQPEFTWSHGMTLEEQATYIDSLELVYDDKTCNRPYRRLRFHAFFDYGEVELIDYTGAAVTVSVTEVPQIVEGYPAAEMFRYTEEKKCKLLKRLLLKLTDRKNSRKGGGDR